MSENEFVSALRQASVKVGLAQPSQSLCCYQILPYICSSDENRLLFLYLFFSSSLFSYMYFVMLLFQFVSAVSVSVSVSVVSVSKILFQELYWIYALTKSGFIN